MSSDENDSLKSGLSGRSMRALHFPLSICTVVDSRLSSRREIVTKINGTALFQKVVEPETLNDAFGVLCSRKVDTCIVGPTLTHNGAQRFIEVARSISRATDCAFVVVVDGRNISEAELLSKIAHAVLSSPCSARMFADGVRRAVYNAADASSEKVKKLSAFFECHEKDKPLVRNGKEVEKYGEHGIGVSMLLQSDGSDKTLIETMLGRQVTSEEVCRISSEAVDTLRVLIRSVLESKGRSQRSEQFARFLEICIHDWVEDLIEHPECNADMRLRQKLLIYTDVKGSLH
jgi:hypothetical protein